MNSEKRREQINLDSRCFAQETLIRMADGQEKQINAIRVGEKVFSVSGKAVRVMDIIVGIEEKVVVLVTQSGKRIRLTSDHPVLTEQRGIQRVNALLATDKVQTADRDFEEIDNLYTESTMTECITCAWKKKVSSLVTALRWEILILCKIFGVLPLLPRFQKRGNTCLIL